MPDPLKGLGGLSQGIGGLLSAFGSDKPPKSILDRNVASTAKGVNTTAANLLKNTGADANAAYAAYMAQQPKQEALAGQQEGVIQQLLARRLAQDPNQNLQSIGNTLFGFIDPNVVQPLSRHDVDRYTLQARARGLNPAAVHTTAQDLMNARIASGRLYDLAHQVYGVLPGIYGQAYNQGVTNEQLASGAIPSIAQAYEGVSNRPFIGIGNRIAAIQGAQNVGAGAIKAITGGPAVMGYQPQRNWHDRLGQGLTSVGNVLVRQGQESEQEQQNLFNNALRAYQAYASGGLSGIRG